MPNYIVNANAQPNGDNEVHVYPQQHSSCSYPAPANQVHLGEFTSGAALLRRRLFRLFIGVFARGRSLFGSFCAGTAPTRLFRAASPA